MIGLGVAILFTQGGYWGLAASVLFALGIIDGYLFTAIMVPALGAIAVGFILVTRQ